jgi:hypothetical protein
MSPKDPVHLPLRWEFLPVQSARDGAVLWKWRAYTQTGKLSMEGEQPFETLTECMNDARANGYGAK